MTKSFPFITQLFYTMTVTLTECLCQLAHVYTHEASAFILWKSSWALACKTQQEWATKKRKGKQNPALFRTSLSSAQETTSLQFKNSFRFSLRISVLKFWKKKRVYFYSQEEEETEKNTLVLIPTFENELQCDLGQDSFYVSLSSGVIQ